MSEERTTSASNWRFDPFTETYNAVLVSNEPRTVPGSSPYQIRLHEVPREDYPSTVTCVIQVQLDEDLDASETDVDVLAAHYGRTQVNDILVVDDEQMLITAKPGSPTLTVTRGYGGTTPATHSTGTMMEIINAMTEINSGSPASREFRVDYKYNTGLVLFNVAEASFGMRFAYYGLGTPLSEVWLMGADNVRANDVAWSSGGASGTIGTSSFVDVYPTAKSIYPSIVGDMSGDHLRMSPIDDAGPADPNSPGFRINNDDTVVGRDYDVDWYYVTASAGPKMWAIIAKNGDVQHIYHMEEAPHVEYFPEKFRTNVREGEICQEIGVTAEILKSMKERRAEKRPLIKVFRDDFKMKIVGKEIPTLILK